MARVTLGPSVLGLLVALLGCTPRQPSPRAPASDQAETTKAPRPLASTAGDAALSPPLDEKAVASATGAATVEKGPDGVVKASFPRADVEVSVDGWRMPPFLGLTSWASFAPARAGVADAMVMGDLVLFEDEVSPVMSVLLESGATVTALHNHFFYDAPRVYFMHIGGEGSVAALGKAVRMAIETTSAIRKKTPKPAATFGPPALPAKSTIAGAQLEAILGTKGQSKEGMFKATIGRTTTAACGCSVGKAMGINTWAAFAGSDETAVVDGDFAVTEDELKPVLATLRGSGIHIVAIHHHMTGERPRILFLHYWGKGRAADLARAVRKALDLTAVDKTAEIERRFTPRPRAGDPRHVS